MNEPEILFLIDNIPEEILLRIKAIIEDHKAKRNITSSEKVDVNRSCPPSKPFTSNDPDCCQVELHRNEMIITKSDLAHLQMDNVNLFNQNQKLLEENANLNKTLKLTSPLRDGECIVTKVALDQLRDAASLSAQREDLSKVLHAALLEQERDVKYLRAQLAEANTKIKTWMKHSDAQVKKLLAVKEITDTI